MPVQIGLAGGKTLTLSSEIKTIAAVEALIAGAASFVEIETTEGKVKVNPGHVTFIRHVDQSQLR
jgi:F0F1-type ATP synthase epsilon subunit